MIPKDFRLQMKTVRGSCESCGLSPSNCALLSVNVGQKGAKPGESEGVSMVCWHLVALCFASYGMDMALRPEGWEFESVREQIDLTTAN